MFLFSWLCVQFLELDSHFVDGFDFELCTCFMCVILLISVALDTLQIGDLTMVCSRHRNEKYVV
jgi:hypothetical protein